MRLRTGLRALLFLALGVSTVQAQERAAGFGIVRDPQGNPWSGAVVHLVHQVLPGFGAEDLSDRLSVTTDAQGRFRTRLLVGARYTVWADEGGEGPVLRCSEVLVGQIARTPMILKEVSPVYRRRLKLDLHPSLEGHELSWLATAEVGGIKLSRRVRLGPEGSITLPPWPTFGISLQGWIHGSPAMRMLVPTKLLVARRYGLLIGSGAAQPQLSSEELQAPTTVKVPEIHRRSISITDRATGLPVPGATLVYESDHPSLGKPPVSDAQGHLVLWSVDEGSWLRPRIRAAIAGPGHAERSLEIAPKLTMTGGHSVTGRILLGKQGLADLPVLVDASMSTGPSGSWFGVASRVWRTAEDGRFRIPGRTGTFPFRLSLALSPDLRKRLRARDPESPILGPVALLAVENSEGPKDLGDVHLEKLRALDVEVENPDGTPPGSVRVLLMPVLPIRTENRPHAPLLAHTDRKGRVRVLVGNASELFVHAATRDGAHWQLVGPRADKVTLRLSPRHAIRFRFVDSDDRPLVGRKVGYVRPEVGASEIDPRILRTVGDLCSKQAFRFKYGRTDEHGEVRLLSPLLGVRLDLVIYPKAKGKQSRRDVVLPAEYDGEAIEVRVDDGE
mgnify:CR=1 FL=1